MKYRLRTLAFLFGFGGAAVVLLCAFFVDNALGKEVLMITPHDPAVVTLNRELFLEGDPVAQVYGNPLSEPVRVVLPAKRDLFRPDEDPSLVLLQVDKNRGQNPLQTRTVWFLTQIALAGFVLLGAGGFLLPRRRAA